MSRPRSLLLTVPLAFLLLGATCLPTDYCPVPDPIPPPLPGSLGGGLDGFDSPYLGHTGSWDGRGGALGGASKGPDMDREVAMGLRWTFMAIYWRAMEPHGPIALHDDPAWAELDRFVREAHDRGLNILLQAPVVGGNAGGPPDWAGRREPGKSAPGNMRAAAAFAGKLALRYRPGGILATREGWGDSYGIRAWELDNEPESYLTHWEGQAGDYAEFATLCARAIRASDPDAVIVGPAISDHRSPWLEQALDAWGLAGSPFYRQRGIPFSIGPALDVASFHLYEGMDSYLAGRDETVECHFLEIRDTFQAWETVPGFEYDRKQEYWHTEGNFDFGLGNLSNDQKASWYLQFLTRAFAAGVRKACIMDATPEERTAVGIYTALLPRPHPMEYVPQDVDVLAGKALVFRHPRSPDPRDGFVWVLWAADGTPGARVRIPVLHPLIRVFRHDGATRTLQPAGHRLVLDLEGGRDASATYLVVDAG